MNVKFYSLKNKKTFRIMLSSSLKHRCNHLNIYHINSDENLLGIIIPKRHARLSVYRNQVKRLCKNIFREFVNKRGIYIIKVNNNIEKCSLDIISQELKVTLG